MRWVVLVAAMVVVVSPPAGALPVEVELDMSSNPDCAVEGLDPELCPVSWDHGTPGGVGDDSIVVNKFVNEVRVTAYLPAGDPVEVAVEPASLSVEHPVNRILKEKWIWLNESLPPGAREYVTFEARPLKNDPTDEGVFVVVHSPVPIPNGNGHYEEVSAGHCWNICQLQDQRYMDMDEDTIRPFPENVLLPARSSDGLIRGKLDEFLACGPPYPNHPAVCGALAQAHEETTTAFGELQEALPNVGFGFQFNRTVVAVLQQVQAALDEAGVRVPGADAEPSHGAARAPPVPAPEPDGPAGDERLPREGLPHAPAGDASGASRETLASALDPIRPVGSTAVLAAIGAAAAVALGLLLYHRITRARALEQATRRRIFELIEHEPGIRVGTLAVKLGLDHNSVKRHVLLLEGLGLIKGIGEGHKHYFAQGKISPREAQARAQALTSPSAKAIYDLLRARGPLDLPALGRALGLAASTVSVNTSRLRRAGLVDVTRVGKRVVAKAVSASALGRSEAVEPGAALPSGLPPADPPAPSWSPPAPAPMPRLSS